MGNKTVDTGFWATHGAKVTGVAGALVGYVFVSWLWPGGSSSCNDCVTELGGGDWAKSTCKLLDHRNVSGKFGVDTTSGKGVEKMIAGGWNVDNKRVIGAPDGDAKNQVYVLDDGSSGGVIDAV